MTIIAKKLAFYTDSIGHDSGNPIINLAANVCAKLPGTTFDAQQLGGQTMLCAYSGLFANGAANWLGGLTMAQHTEMIQPDTIVLHLGGNDADPYIRGTSGNLADSSVAYLMSLYGQSAAASGRKIAVVQAPSVVVTDYPGYFTDPDAAAAAHAYRDINIARLQIVRDAVVAQINSLYPGAAQRIDYHGSGAIAPVTMGPNDTTDGLHPIQSKHLEISHSIAKQIGAWRGWPAL